MFESISKVLLITDMDGTFLPTNKIPSSKNLEAVKRFQDAGGKFSIATGRALQATEQYFQSFSVDFPFILCNGGMIYDPERKISLFDVFLPDCAKAYAEEIFNAFDTVGGEILTIDNVNVPRYTDMEKEHTKICKVTPKVVSMLDEIYGGWYKTLFCDTPENIDKIIDFVQSKNYKNVDFVRSAPVYYEMLPQNISKGTALKEMRKLCGLDDYTIVAVGDYNNDIEMLKAADVSFCPSNSTVEVKSASDHILENSCDEDAISAVIERIFRQVNN